MSVKVHNPLLRFDTGVEEVIRGSKQQVSLPRKGVLAPNTAASRPVVEDVLFKPSLNEELSAYFVPLMEDSSVLVPGQYHRLLRDVIDKLYAAAELDEAHAALYERAADFLSSLEESYGELHDRRQGQIHG